MPLKRTAESATATDDKAKTYIVYKQHVAMSIARMAVERNVPFTFCKLVSNRVTVGFKDEGLFVFSVLHADTPTHQENMDAIVFAHTHSSEWVPR